jgi:hypothetical protein
MPYRGKSVSIAEMLDILVDSGRTEAAAALEIERAIEDQSIVLLLPNGSDERGETLYVQMSPLGRSHVIAFVRAFPNRMQNSLSTHARLPLQMIQAARAIRSQFEDACGLSAESAPSAGDTRMPPLEPMQRKDAVQACIDAGMVPAKNATWDTFCEKVRDLADGWADKKAGTLNRGFDEKTIKRDVKEIMN